MRRARAGGAVALALTAAGCSLLGLYETPPAGGPGVDCPAPYRQCGEDCVDLENDAEHCGDCGILCRPDQSCDNECVCRPGLSTCEGEALCVDFASNPQHCGECSRSCDSGHCEDGQCVDQCNKAPCGDGSCVDHDVDPLHCGDCGTACAEDQICVAGECLDYRPALAESCAEAQCDEAEVCCVVHTTQVCVSGLDKISDCP